MKQTAVEVIENKVEAEAIALFDGELTFNEFMDNINKHFNEAKEMEKEQKKEYNYYKEYWEVRNLKKTK